MKNILLLLSTSLGCLGVAAQFNDSIHYRVNFGTTGIINKTNDGSSYVLSNALRLNLKKKDFTVNSTSSYIFGQQEKKVTNNDVSSTLDFNLAKTFKHFYYWGLANYDKSLSLKIVNRLQTGIGGAYNVVDKPDAFLNLSEGIIFETSNLKINDSTFEKYSTFRNSFRIRYHWVLKEIIVLDGMNFFQPSFSNSNDYIIKSVNSLSVKLRKWLNFTAAVNYNKVQLTKRDNLLITFGFTAEKYF